MQQHSNNVRTQPAPVNDSGNTVTGDDTAVQVPEHIRTDPRWRSIWKTLLAPPAAKNNDKAA